MRDDIGSPCQGGADDQTPRLAVNNVIQFAGKAVLQLKKVPGGGSKTFAGIGQGDGDDGSVEKLHAHFFFRISNMLAQRRLRDKELFCCAGKAFFFGDCQYVAQGLGINLHKTSGSYTYMIFSIIIIIAIVFVLYNITRYNAVVDTRFKADMRAE